MGLCGVATDRRTSSRISVFGRVMATAAILTTLASSVPFAHATQNGSRVNLGRYSVEAARRSGWTLAHRGPGIISFGGGTSALVTKIAMANLLNLSPEEAVYLATTDPQKALAELAQELESALRSRLGYAVLSITAVPRKALWWSMRI